MKIYNNCAQSISLFSIKENWEEFTNNCGFWFFLMSLVQIVIDAAFWKVVVLWFHKIIYRYCICITLGHATVALPSNDTQHTHWYGPWLTTVSKESEWISANKEFCDVPTLSCLGCKKWSPFRPAKLDRFHWKWDRQKTGKCLIMGTSLQGDFQRASLSMAYLSRFIKVIIGNKL